MYQTYLIYIRTCKGTKYVFSSDSQFKEGNAWCTAVQVRETLIGRGKPRDRIKNVYGSVVNHSCAYLEITLTVPLKGQISRLSDLVVLLLSDIRILVNLILLYYYQISESLFIWSCCIIIIRYQNPCLSDLVVLSLSDIRILVYLILLYFYYQIWEWCFCCLCFS